MKAVQTFQVAKNIELVNQSPIGWFYEEGYSINFLHNFIHGTLSIVVPGENFFFRVKLSGNRMKKQDTLMKLYAQYCEKLNVKNIFQK